MGSQSKFSQWMTNLPEEKTNIPINQLAIPGSHDSGCYYLDPDTPFVECSGCKCLTWSFRSHCLQCVCCCLCCCCRSIAINWAITQDYPISHQIQDGVRYFDYRIGYLNTADDFLFVHRVYGGPVIDTFKDIQCFLKENPKEVVILDLNQFYHFTPDGDHGDLHERLAKRILKIFDDMIYASKDPKGENRSMGKLRLSDLWENNKQVIIRYTDETVCHNHKEFWPGDTISSPWFNTPSPTKLISKLNEYLEKHPIPNGKLNVYQAILSPRTSTVAFNLCCTLREKFFVKASVATKEWLADVYRNCKKGVNIVICDFISAETCIPDILKLNEVRTSSETS